MILRSTAGRARRCHPTRSYVDQLEEDTELQATEMVWITEDHQLWSGIVVGHLTDDE